MLVLSSTAPKPIAVPLPPASLPIPNQARIEAESDPISLRPFCRNGGGSFLPSPVPVHEWDKELLTSPTLPMPDWFVPPQLRPGFVGKGERPEMQKHAGSRVRNQFPAKAGSLRIFISRLTWGGSDQTAEIRRLRYDGERRQARSQSGQLVRGLAEFKRME